MGVDSLRHHLRQQTAAVHAQLDAAVGEFSNTESYGRYLAGLYAFREPVERALLASAISLEGWRPAPIAPLIKQDMSDLNISAADIQSNSDIRFSSPLSSADLLGTLYVLQGASLGARLLYKRAQALGLSRDHGARHLAAQAEDRESWPRFLSALEGAQPQDIEAATRASLATFSVALNAFGVADGR